MSNIYARFTRLSATACVLLLSAASVFPQGHPLPPAENVSAVWDVKGQPCNGNRGSTMQRAKNQKAIGESRRLELPSIGMSVSLPQLPGYSHTVVKLVLDDRSRGVVDHYVLFGQDDIGTPSAAIVFTELPRELDTTAKVFSTVEYMESSMAAPVGIKPTFQRIQGPFGEALETITPGRVGSHCFPTADWRLAEGGAKDSTLGISRFAVIDRKLVEFTLLLKVGPQRTPEDQAAYARKIMDGFWLALNTRPAERRDPVSP